MSGLFGAKTPKPEPVVPMPDEQEQDAARKKQLMEARARSGRASTILSGDYSKDKLG